MSVSSIFKSPYLEGAHEGLINTHHCPCIVKLATVVWSRKQCHQLPFGKKFISIFYHLNRVGESINQIYERAQPSLMPLCQHYAATLPYFMVSFCSYVSHHFYLLSLKLCNFPVHRDAFLPLRPGVLFPTCFMLSPDELCRSSQDHACEEIWRPLLNQM